MHSDSSFVVFRTIKPYTPNHLLVCPRKHIKSALDLQPGEDGAAILQHMIDLAHRVVAENGLSTTEEPPQLSFHVPPFNSIDHLHLHVIPGA